MKSYRKLVRPAVLLLVAIVAVFACSAVANAGEGEVAFTPRGQMFTYSLPPGGIMNIPVPAANMPISVTGTCITPNVRGVAEITLLRTVVAPLFLEWVGLESAWPGAQTITKGFSAVVGTHIVYLDWQQLVDIEVGSPTGSFIRVHNTSTGLRQGFVTMMY